MTRNEMARKLYEKAGSPKGYLDFKCANDFWLCLAELAVAECAKAAEEGYRNGFSDGGNLCSVPRPTWQNSDTRAKWGTP